MECARIDGVGNILTEPVQRLVDLAWAAGFLDGEGCFYIGKKDKSSSYIQISAVQKAPELLYRLQRLFGGKVYEYKKREDRGTEICEWRLAYYQEVAKVCVALYPFMSEKRKAEISELLYFWRTKSWGKSKKCPSR